MKQAELDSLTSAITKAIELGRTEERKRITSMLLEYFALTQEPSCETDAENPEWDAGFQAAIALIKGNPE
jgi:hypothetical protein